jgi:putative FmdB family regulatory protein
MPFYEYQCTSCGHHTEVLQKITDAPLKKCPECGKSALRKLMSAPVFRLKGSGWYETDFKSDKENKRNLAGPEPEEAKSEAKPDAKPADGKDTAKEGAKSGADKVEGGGDAAKPPVKPVAKPAKPLAKRAVAPKRAKAKSARSAAKRPARR